MYIFKHEGDNPIVLILNAYLNYFYIHLFSLIPIQMHGPERSPCSEGQYHHCKNVRNVIILPMYFKLCR